MKHNYFTILLLLLSSVMFSQEDAWVYFKDKPNAESFLDSPSKMLSVRALERRANQKISLDLTDVPIEETYINQIKTSRGITIKAHSKWLNALHIRGTVEDILALESLSFVDKVVYADNFFNETSKKVSENKTVKTKNKLKTAIDYAYGNSANQIQMLNGQVLHQQNYTGSGKIIAVLDAGFPNVNTVEPFKRLRDNNQILGGYDFVSRNENFYTGDDHGTKVLSTMGGYKENALVGTAPDASYYLFITEDDNSENPVEESNWVEAAEKADSLGVDIITTSLGYFEFDNAYYNHTYSDMNGSTFISRGAEIAFSKGIIVVASAGNEGATTEPHIGAPADAVSVLTVGSVNSSKVKSSFSSIGPSFDGRIKPDVMAQGSSTVLSDVNGNIVTANGTSFSCPVMAGMIACLWQANPSKTNKEIRQMILESSDNFLTPDNNYGYGIPNFGATLAVENFKASADFSVFPNPAKMNISFLFSDETNTASVSIYSVLGQKLIEKQITTQDTLLSLESLSSGIYFFTFDAEGLHKTGKIIKQ